MDKRRKEGVAVPLSQGELGPRLTQCGLGRGLLPYQVASSFIQPFGHNRHGPKIGALCPLFGGEGAVSPSNTMLLGSRPTSLPSGILIRPAIWPQQIWAENWGGLCPFGEGSWVPIEHSVARAKAYLHTSFILGYIQRFGHNTPTLQTDRQTDRTDNGTMA